MEQHFQTVYVTIYLWAVSLPILPNLHIEGEREIEIGVVGTFFHPATDKQTIKFQGKTSLFLKSLANEI